MREQLAAHDVSVAQLVQHVGDGRASLDLVLHEAPLGACAGARRDRAFPEVLEPSLSRAGRLGAAAVTRRTLGEGNTPLLHAPRLSERLGVELWLKFEGANPTGSFKDRGMSVAVDEGGRGRGTRARLRLDRQHRRVVRRVRGTRRAEAIDRRRRGRAASAKLAQVRASAARSSRSTAPSPTRSTHAEELGGRTATCSSTRRTRTASRAEDGGVRDPRAARRRPRRADAALRRRRQHEGVRARLLEARRRCRASIPARRPTVPTRSPRRSASSSRSTAPRSRMRSTLPAARSSRSTTMRSLRALARLGREEGFFCEPASAAGIAGLARLGRAGRARRLRRHRPRAEGPGRGRT